jgi:hypothetical protein
VRSASSHDVETKTRAYKVICVRPRSAGYVSSVLQFLRPLRTAMRFSAVLVVLAASARLVDAFPHMMGAGFGMSCTPVNERCSADSHDRRANLLSKHGSCGARRDHEHHGHRQGSTWWCRSEREPVRQASRRCTPICCTRTDGPAWAMPRSVFLNRTFIALHPLTTAQALTSLRITVSNAQSSLSTLADVSVRLSST